MPAAEEALLKRVLPHSIEAEQSVIGAMIMDREAITVTSEIISGDDFYSRQYGVVFDAMVELNDEGKPVDVVTLSDKGCTAGGQQSGIFKGSAECQLYIGECQVLCQYRSREGNPAKADPVK